jgi:NNP family nitrate/nitrite transporter-like MFS transporter
MHHRDFLKAGHTPTLLCAFLYFDVSFMAWVLIGALGAGIADEMRLSPAASGFLTAVPILGGAILRIVLGVLTDRYGPRATGIIGMAVTLIPLLGGWLWADDYYKLLAVGLLLGVAGASFAAALPLASRWYPPQYQGLALGIAGAGNSGTAFATFFAPMLAAALGWHAVFGLALIPMLLTLAVFVAFAKDSPTQPKPKTLAQYAEVLEHADTWWFCLFYLVTFGGFVGFASFLGLFFRTQYDLSPIHAGYCTTACVIAGSFLRPVGGMLADRLGGVRLLLVLYTAVSALLMGVATLPPLFVAGLLLFAAMGVLGMGNGAVFQLVPQRFPKEIGVITGIVGAAGGVGGFLLPNFLGSSKQWTGSYSAGFLAFALISATCLATIGYVSQSWRAFIGPGGTAAPEPAAALDEVMPPALPA